MRRGLVRCAELVRGIADRLDRMAVPVPVPPSSPSGDMVAFARAWEKAVRRSVGSALHTFQWDLADLQIVAVAPNEAYARRDIVEAFRKLSREERLPADFDTIRPKRLVDGKVIWWWK